MLINAEFVGYNNFDKLLTEIEKNGSDLSSCYKLGRHLIHVRKQDRQNCAKACQLLSRTTGMDIFPFQFLSTVVFLQYEDQKTVMVCNIRSLLSILFY